MPQNLTANMAAIPRAAVSTAIFRAGQVLLVQRNKPPNHKLWSLPGGHIEAGERAADAALRELKEETDILADLKGIAGVRDLVQQTDRGEVLWHRVIIVFCGLWREGEARAQSDVLAVRWVHPGKLDDLACTEGLAGIVADAARMVG